MAATRLIAMHKGKGRTVTKSLQLKTDYAKNPEKTEKGELVTGYGCDPKTVDEEFLLQKRQYTQITGKTQASDVIAYQIRQSFKPGEVSAEEANQIGRELALRFTKGKYSFIVATHTDRAHIHNHIIFNSTAMDGSRKFKDFLRSGLALQRLSDLVCLEHGLSVIEPRPYREREKQIKYLVKETLRESICRQIDCVLEKTPLNFEAFLDDLRKAGFEVKTGANISLKGPGQKCFVRLSSLPDGYREEDILAYLSGEKKDKRKIAARKQLVEMQTGLSLVIDIQNKLKDKGPAYQRWATIFNLKQMSKTLLFLRDHGIENADELSSFVKEREESKEELLNEIKALEERLNEISELRRHIINYSKTRSMFEEYKKSGYNQQFLEEHREEIISHKSSKEAFDKLKGKRVPTVKELAKEYDKVLMEKREKIAEWKKIREETKEAAVAMRNVENMMKEEEKKVGAREEKIDRG